VNRPDPLDVELRAYQIWRERGQSLGTPDEDWFKAEHELMAEAENPLAMIARKVGAVLGAVVALLTDPIDP
jgi:hypothetical protein